MFLEKAKLTIDQKSEKIPADQICWDYEDAYNHDDDTTLSPHDFDWYLTDFLLDNIALPEYQDTFIDFIESAVDFEKLLDECPESWEGIWRTLQDGGDIHTPVNIALAYQPGYEGEKLFISDGWHRVSLYLRAGRKTIPAIVGISKKD